MIRRKQRSLLREVPRLREAKTAMGISISTDTGVEELIGSQQQQQHSNTNRLTNNFSNATTIPRHGGATSWREKFSMAAHKINPHVLFPWRHEECLLPRLDPKEDDYYLQGSYFGPGLPPLPSWYQWCVTQFCLYHLLQAPWYSIIQTNNIGWKKEFSNSSAWAFNQAVAGILSNCYDVPFRNVRCEEEVEENGDNDDFMVVIEHLVVQKEKEQQHKSSSAKSISDGSSSRKDESPDLDCMIEEKLRELYKSANKHGRGQLQIDLKMRSTSATLLSVFCIPFLTRENVKINPSLQHTYLNLFLRTEDECNGIVDASRFIYSELNQLGSEQIKFEDDHAVLSSTVIVQILVNCEEIFRVADVVTGRILQGHKDGKVRNVSHLVRLEAVVNQKRPYDKKKKPSFEIGAWQITDWDDLLEGNIWFL
mmetsp:Transcript_14731/g.16870  ORF Transcript_14731/g.16870 Transcript_14731/m.16870 type:complete len:423 (-) Transcript_14731:44-1312(-)|eukprot:CAMPEP_0194138194 /NCGR_PEP_ID=MMETSP0152-20130528/8039_1 /TAXON_ID=1049557 /ORGANISM="Thalassiothrix antarctica, Strain L6-D1" /LENGTH=422 /DNA_ID=CAMNT_0038835579 /DNA_START=81 /DNA_END=1349 /DNA_ORIENTATION=+